MEQSKRGKDCGFEEINTYHNQNCYLDMDFRIEGNDAAKKLYEGFGFIEVERDDDEVIMELEL